MLDLTNSFKLPSKLLNRMTVLVPTLPMTLSSSGIITVLAIHKDSVQTIIKEVGQLWGNILNDTKHPLHTLARRHLNGITTDHLTRPAEAKGHLIFTPACQSRIWSSNCLYLDAGCITRLAHLHRTLDDKKLLVCPDQLEPHIYIAAFDKVFKLQAAQVTPRAQARELSLG